MFQPLLPQVQVTHGTKMYILHCSLLIIIIIITPSRCGLPRLKNRYCRAGRKPQESGPSQELDGFFLKGFDQFPAPSPASR